MIYQKNMIYIDLKNLKLLKKNLEKNFLIKKIYNSSFINRKKNEIKKKQKIFSLKI